MKNKARLLAEAERMVAQAEAKQRRKVVILDTISEGLVIGHIKHDDDGMASLAIIYWEALETYLPTIDICNFEHPIKWIEPGAYSVTVWDDDPNDDRKMNPRHLEIYAWAQPRKGADPYMIRFAFDEPTGTYYIKERIERG